MDRIALALLVLCNFVWSLNGLAGKALLETYSGPQVGWLRYASAFVAYFLFAAARVLLGGRRWRDYFLVPRSASVAIDLAVLACGPFVLSPIVQFVGLRTVQAMDYSILIAIEPLITVLLAWFVLGERMRRIHTIAMSIALFGFLLFSGLIPAGLGSFPLGMIFLIFAQAGDSAYSVFGKKLAEDFEPNACLGSALGLGAILLTVFVAIFDRLPDPAAAGLKQGAALLWLGPVASTGAYLLWTVVSRRIAVATASITIFIQPVIGAVMGFVFLHEGLGLARFVGAILILVAIASLSLQELRAENSPTA